MFPKQHIIRTLLILDDSRDRESISMMLESFPTIAIIGEASTRETALESIRTKYPDLIILEVLAQDFDGFDLLEEVSESERPEVIFISRYGDLAAKAFDRRAIDYIVRPCTPERLAIAVQRVQQWFGTMGSGRDGDGYQMSNGQSDPEASARSFLDRLVVKAKDRIYFLRTADVEWIEAAADYVHVHAQGKRHIIRAKIGDLEKRLDPARFVRIHRSAIVHIDHISELRPMYHGEFQVVLSDRTELTMSRSYRSRLSKFLANPI